MTYKNGGILKHPVQSVIDRLLTHDYIYPLQKANNRVIEYSVFGMQQLAVDLE